MHYSFLWLSTLAGREVNVWSPATDVLSVSRHRHFRVNCGPWLVSSSSMYTMFECPRAGCHRCPGFTCSLHSALSASSVRTSVRTRHLSPRSTVRLTSGAIQSVGYDACSFVNRWQAHYILAFRRAPDRLAIREARQAHRQFAPRSTSQSQLPSAVSGVVTRHVVCARAA